MLAVRTRQTILGYKTISYSNICYKRQFLGQISAPHFDIQNARSDEVCVQDYGDHFFYLDPFTEEFFDYEVFYVVCKRVLRTTCCLCFGY